MRIYKVNIEHKKWGLNWRSVKVAARTATEAIRKTQMTSSERVEGIMLLVATD